MSVEQILLAPLSGDSGDDTKAISAGTGQKLAVASAAGLATETARAEGIEATLAQGTNPTAVKTSSYAAAVGDDVRVDISGGSVATTLPTTPADKTRVGLKVIKISGTPGSTAATLVCGGSDRFNVAGGSTTLTLTALFQGVIAQYHSSDGIWMVQSTDTPLGSALGAGKVGADGYLGTPGQGGTALTPSVESVASAYAADHIPDLSEGVGFGAEFAGGGAASRSSYIPTFTKSANNPFLTIAAQNLTSMEQPCVLPVKDIFGGPGPFGELLRCYYSTDHAQATAGGGVGLATCASETPEDGTPWVAQSLFFQDMAGGIAGQSDYPWVMYVPDDPAGPSFYMTYNKGGDPNQSASQVTKMATMTVAQALTAESWTISPLNNGIVFDTPLSNHAGSYVTNNVWGYARPMRIGADWIAYTLARGLPVGQFALWRSKTGLPGTWTVDKRFMQGSAHLMTDARGRFNPSSHYPAWNHSSIIRWKGQLWWYGAIFNYAGGGSKPEHNFVGIAPISSDYRRLLATPYIVFNSTQAWEASVPGAPAAMSDYRSGGSLVVGFDNKLRLFYQGNGESDHNDGSKCTNGAFGIAVAT